MRAEFGPRLVEAVRRNLWPLGQGLLVALGVCLPWLGGRVFALDWVLGPQSPAAPRTAFGLDGGLNASLPFGAAVALLGRATGAAATWLPYLIFFPLGAATFAALMRYAGASRWAQSVGALLFVVNPWVLDRLAVGHVGLLLGYDLLPTVVLVLLRHQGQAWKAAAKLGILLAVVIALSPHYLWIAAPLVAAAVIIRPRRVRAVAWSGVAYAMAAACSAYLLIGPLVATQPHTAPGRGDLNAYETWGSNAWRAAGNIVGLQGFWRPIPQEPSRFVPAWPVLSLAVVALAVLGLTAAWRAEGPGREVSRVLTIAGAVGLMLALGARGPFGGVYETLYDGLPLFRVMREPQKWAALLALAYAGGLALAVDELLRTAQRRRARLAGAAVLSALVLGVTPTLFWGVAGSIHSSTIPESYTQADKAMGEGGVLVLPWHLYMSFSYTDGRVIANPAPYFFHRDVLSGDAAELPGVREQQTTARSQRVAELVSQAGSLQDAGSRIAQLGVRYVALLHGGDWPSYGWLDHQRDLRPVFSSPEIDVWEVGTAQLPGRGCQVRRASTPRYKATCSGTDLVIPEAYDPGWRVGGAKPYETTGGLVGFHVRPGSVVASYGPARGARALLFLSALAFAILVVLSAPNVIQATLLSGSRDR